MIRRMCCVVKYSGLGKYTLANVIVFLELESVVLLSYNELVFGSCVGLAGIVGQAFGLKN